MTCKQCGKCCNTLILPALEYDEEIIKMREGFVGKVKFKGDTYFVLNAKCTYLNSSTNKCGIYRDRPDECKKFPGLTFSEFWKLINPKCGELKKLITK